MGNKSGLDSRNVMSYNVDRCLLHQLCESVSYFPVTCILGPRQAGKSTLAKQFLHNRSALYLDLEKPSDLAKLDSPEVFFSQYTDQLICLDEIQRKPEFFPIIRSIVDETNRPGQFLILGSASIDLLNQSSESLAGRIEYLELSPFLETEVTDFFKYWIRGGFPDSYLSPTDDLSNRWRDSFILTFLERDIPQLNFKIPSENLRRFWQMCAHYHGQLVNYSAIGSALNLSHTTIRHYVDVLQSTYMVRLLPPYHSNDKKRLIKSPKLYLRDSGVLHRLLQLSSFEECAGHPLFGASFEGLVIENIAMQFTEWSLSFYRTVSGAEVDLILMKGHVRVAVEIKATKSPQVNAQFHHSCSAMGVQKKYIIALVDTMYEIKHDTTVCYLNWFLTHFEASLGST